MASSSRRASLIVALVVALVGAYFVRTNAADAAQAGPFYGDLELIDSQKPGPRVLFVGNSFTEVNRLDRIVSDIAKGTSTPVITAAYARGAATMKQADGDAQLTALINGHRWTHVVLQEQSQLQSFNTGQRMRESDPYVAAMVRKVDSIGATPLLYATGGYRDGDQRNVPGDSFNAMQQRLDGGFMTVTKAFKFNTVPTNIAWADVVRKHPEIDLYAEDGVHPSPAGSYLVATVFYEVLTGQQPKATGVPKGVTKAEAATLRATANAAFS